MPQAVVDPDELRDFAANLQRYNELLTDSTATLQSQFARLGETWRDQEQVKFGEEFDQTVKVIGQFLRASEEHIPFLIRKAGEIDQYLGR
jgi:uncharacterized protein YukE